MAKQPRKPQLQRKPSKAQMETITPGVSGTPVDLQAMADEELAKPNNGAQPDRFIAPDQYLEDPKAAPAQVFTPKEEKKAARLRRKLKEELGIETIEPHHVKVGSFKWTLVALNLEDGEWAAGNANENVSNRNAHFISLETALTAIAVRAVDDMPVYELFEVEIPKDDQGTPLKISDPLNPPDPIKFAAAEHVLHWIKRKLSDKVASRLYTIYATQVDPKTEVDVTFPFSEESSPTEKTKN